MGAGLFHADGKTSRDRQTDRQTDMMKLTVAFHNYANAPKNGNKSSGYIKFGGGWGISLAAERNRLEEGL